MYYLQKIIVASSELNNWQTSSEIKKKPPEVSRKEAVPNLAIFTGKHLCFSLFLIKFQAFRPICSDLQRYWEETQTQVFSCEYCEIFKKICIEEHLQRAASLISSNVSWRVHTNERWHDNEVTIKLTTIRLMTKPYFITYHIWEKT